MSFLILEFLICVEFSVTCPDTWHKEDFREAQSNRQFKNNCQQRVPYMVWTTSLIPNTGEPSRGRSGHLHTPKTKGHTLTALPPLSPGLSRVGWDALTQFVSQQEGGGGRGEKEGRGKEPSLFKSGKYPSDFKVTPPSCYSEK